MHWISAYRTQLNIGVLNLSWGPTSRQDPAIDPLNYAVQRLWQEGIVVVTAAGNSGPQVGTTVKPADDPLVVTAGAFDDKQNVDPADDSVRSRSSRGPTATGFAKPGPRRPRPVAHGHPPSGSHIEATCPKATVAPSYIRGSYTSDLRSIEASRVGADVEADCEPDGVVDLIRGEIDVRCEAWSPADWVGTRWTGDAGTGDAIVGAASSPPSGASR